MPSKKFCAIVSTFFMLFTAHNAFAQCGTVLECAQEMAATSAELKAQIARLQEDTYPSNLVPMFHCPAEKKLTKGGNWGFYECQGQISSKNTCLNIEDPYKETLDCVFIGYFRLILKK